MSDTHKHYMYMNKSKEEMMAFTNGYLLAKCIKNTNANVYELYQGNDVANANDKKLANQAFFAEIIGMIGDHVLVTTLATLHTNDGVAALQAIKDEWEDGDTDNKESNAVATYFTTLYDSAKALTADVTPEEFNTKCNLLHTCRLELKDTNRGICDEAHAANLIDWISGIDAEFKSDIKWALMGKTVDQKVSPTFVAKTLSSIIRTRSSKVTKSDTDSIKTLKTTPADTKSEKQKCPKCGEFHWFNPKYPERCMTYMRACGKTPDKWDDKTETFRKSIDEKANALADKLRGKDPNIGPKVAVTKVASKVTPSQISTEDAPTHLVMRLKVPEESRPSIVYIDSQGGTGYNYHFIKDKHLFDSIDTSYKTVNVGGVIGMTEGSTTPSKGKGTCTVDVLTASGPVAMSLTNCLYVPGMDSNVFNVW